MARFIKFFSIFLLGILLFVGCASQSKNKIQEKVDTAQEKVQNKGQVQGQTKAAFLSDIRNNPQKEGCTSCHTGIKKINGKEIDVSLAAETLKLKTSNGGKHPQVQSGTPFKQCMTCHRTLKVEKTVINAIHIAHAKSKAFGPKYSGNCASCHGMKDNGEVFVKGLD